MARAEGQQVDTLPMQMYGVDADGVIRKIKVNASGEFILSDKFVPYVDGNADVYYKKNGYTLELWFQDVMVTSYTIDEPDPPAVGTPFGAWLGLWRTYSE